MIPCWSRWSCLRQAVKAKTRRQRQHRRLINPPPNKATCLEPERGQRGQGHARRKPRQPAASRHLSGGPSRLRCFSSSALPGHKSLPRTLGRLFLCLGQLKNCSLSASGQQGPPAGFCPMRPEHGQAFKGQMHRLLLAEMARCQLAASMATHDVTEAVACPAPPSAWSASLASALPADGGAPPPRLPPARAAEGKLKKGCRAASPASAASWRIHGPMRVSQ